MEPQQTGEVTRVDLDVEKCVALHSEIIRMVASASNPPLPICNYSDYWDQETEGIEFILSTFSAELLEFLSQCDVIDDKVQSMTPFVSGLSSPNQLNYRDGEPVFYGDYHECYILYPSVNIETHQCGLVFDIDMNKATWVVSECEAPPSYNKHVWLPLDEILEKWLSEMRRGRFIPSPEAGELVTMSAGPSQGWDLACPPWQDLHDAVEAWEAYVALLESRGGANSHGVSNVTVPRLSSPRLKGFAGHLFERIRKPLFRYIAPELVFPTAEELSALSQRQILRCSEDSAFESHRDGRVDIVATILFPLCRPSSEVIFDVGLCLYDDLAWQDAANLILPVFPGYDSWSQIDAAKPLYPPPDHGRVWQSKWLESPFWQQYLSRLVSVFKKWTELVREGIWTVGPDGIEGRFSDFTNIRDEGFARFRTAGMNIDDPDP